MQNENENKNQNKHRKRRWSEWLPLPSALILLIAEYKRCSADASKEERFREMFLELDHAIVVPFEPNIPVSLHFGTTTTHTQESWYNNTIERQHKTSTQWFEIQAPMIDQPEINAISARMTEAETFELVFADGFRHVEMTEIPSGKVGHLNQHARKLLCQRVRELMTEF